MIMKMRMRMHMETTRKGRSFPSSFPPCWDVSLRYQNWLPESGNADSGIYCREEEEEEDDGDEYDELRYWHMAYGIPEFLEEHEQLMQRLKFLDDPTQLVYRERMEQLERYMILGDWIRQRNKALGIAPEDDHYVPLFPVLEGPENSINLSMFR